MKLPGEKFQASSEQSGRSEDCAVKSVVLNSAEELYTDLRFAFFFFIFKHTIRIQYHGLFRDKNFSAIGTTLSRRAKAISAQYEERHEAKTVTELKQFVAKLPQMQATKQSLALRKILHILPNGKKSKYKIPLSLL